ncbi:hypothetical protein G6F46_000386 [Rhizopus delemar]|uniref:F-box domain-containing protein n=2 Tax=Rhizopus TaxID=4842 RepID=A0A9P6ZD98_9FUNG|nr:hypothetical protein G6F55_000303 [Rhizopus delemar]KAG1552754.1 hypothetical protein G6F51_001029 [Rhizopus arrhizus]KAG1505854.1 hypothetical protein G6F54_000009 [Rhizopus delemar]KAG1518762.1 hypothetical protein G6F53_000333 [Rhizopus delemar]KAG1527779.1 hypothetical protein G6F52_001236 [Rhizopus delemar]
MLSGNNNSQPIECMLVPEKKKEEYAQTDIISAFPKEIRLRIFSFLSFQDLIKIQLTCQLWCRLAQDISVWKSRFQDLNSRFKDIYAHNAAKLSESSSLSWQKRYCQAITLTNWRMGSVQRLTKINVNDSDSRILSVKLRGDLLVTLTEDNSVRLYHYNLDTGFSFKSKYSFGNPSLVNNVVECIDILPDAHVLVIAQRGLKCMFYDINKGPKHDPIQILKGGGHSWFIPDSIAFDGDYFAVAGRKPSVVFVWNWRKGIKLSSTAIDNQPHHVFLSDNKLIIFSSDGLLQVSDIFGSSKQSIITHHMCPCTPHLSKRIYHYQWDSSNYKQYSQTEDDYSYSSSTLIPTTSRKRISSTFINFLRPSHNKNNTNNTFNNNKTQKHVSKSATSRKVIDINKSTKTTKKCSSHNDSRCMQQTKTGLSSGDSKEEEQNIFPNFQEKPKLTRSIHTAPLCHAATEVVSVAIYQDRIATVNRRGNIALYALNGTTAAKVNCALVTSDCYQEWIQNEEQYSREDDDLSDGYDFIRSRLAMGKMGLIYGGRNGSLWWLDFGCRAI